MSSNLAITPLILLVHVWRNFTCTSNDQHQIQGDLTFDLFFPLMLHHVISNATQVSL